MADHPADLVARLALVDLMLEHDHRDAALERTRAAFVALEEGADGPTCAWAERAIELWTRLQRGAWARIHERYSWRRSKFCSDAARARSLYEFARDAALGPDDPYWPILQARRVPATG